jgi:hypothetical protein
MFPGTVRPKRIPVALGVLALGGIVACADVFDPPLPAGTRGFAPPPIYSVWWEMTEACSGLRGSLAAVDWYIVPGIAYLMNEGRPIGGYWSRGSNRIVLAEGAWQDGGLVRHEMLHALLRGGSHPRTAYLERCGGVVVCVEKCLEDAGPGPRPTANAVRVPAESLAIDLSLDPAVPASEKYGGHFMLTVTAHNRFKDSIWVTLPPSYDNGPSASFSYELTGNSRQFWSNDRAWDSEVTVFAPGETKREVFDFIVQPEKDVAAMAARSSASNRRMVPGTYLLRGAFGGRWTELRTVELK